MIDEAAARRRGDIVRGALAPLAGALVGGIAALPSPRALLELATRSLGGHASLDEARALLGSLLVAPLLGAFAGALLFGLLQTRGWLGWQPARIEPRRPATWLALLGGLLVLAIVVDAMGRLVTLHAGAAPLVIASAAEGALRRALQSLVGVALGLAIVDHLLRSRARAARLDVDVVRRAPQPVRDPSPAWLAEAQLVLFDGERAIALGNGKLVARATGLAAIALRETARAAGKRVRAQSGLERYDAHAIGQPA